MTIKRAAKIAAFFIYDEEENVMQDNERAKKTKSKDRKREEKNKIPRPRAERKIYLSRSASERKNFKISYGERGEYNLSVKTDLIE